MTAEISVSCGIRGSVRLEIPSLRPYFALLMTTPGATTPPLADSPGTDWNALLEAYRRPVLWRSVFQLANTSLAFGLIWFAMLWSLDRGYWITLLL